MSIMKSMRSFIASCPHMDRFTGGSIDLTDSDAETYGIIGNGDSVVKRYRGGIAKRQFDCMLVARNWTTEDVDRLENSGFVEDFIFWVEDSSHRRSFPILDSGLTAISISASNGMLAYYDETATTGEYQIQIQLIYMKEGIR